MNVTVYGPAKHPSRCHPKTATMGVFYPPSGGARIRIASGGKLTWVQLDELSVRRLLVDLTAALDDAQLSWE